MIAALDVYKHIFSNIMQHSSSRQHHGKPTASVGLLDQVSETRRSETESALRSLQHKMGVLSGHLSGLNRSKEELLRRLNQIKVTGC